jgi:hypothetical protein
MVFYEGPPRTVAGVTSGPACSRITPVPTMQGRHTCPQGRMDCHGLPVESRSKELGIPASTRSRTSASPVQPALRTPCTGTSRLSALTSHRDVARHCGPYWTLSNDSSKRVVAVPPDVGPATSTGRQVVPTAVGAAPRSRATSSAPGAYRDHRAVGLPVPGRRPRLTYSCGPPADPSECRRGRPDVRYVRPVGDGSRHRAAAA